jgi:predicted acyl esterase
MTRSRPLTIDRRELGRRFLQLAALLALPKSVVASVADPIGAAVTRDVMVPMRDGIRLATDVYLPAPAADRSALRWPVILERTPYGKSQAGTRHASVEVANWFASRGYVVVFQDCRGRGRAAGE